MSQVWPKQYKAFLAKYQEWYKAPAPRVLALALFQQLFDRFNFLLFSESEREERRVVVRKIRCELDLEAKSSYHQPVDAGVIDE